MHSKCGLIICFANIKDWLKSARTWLLIFFFMLLCYMEVSGVLLNMHRENMTLHIAEIPYYFWNYGCNILMSSALLLVSATELPRQIPHQSLLLIRASRKSWLMGQVFYLFAIVFVTIVFMTSCMLVFSFGKIVWQTGWSDTMRLSSGLFVESNAAVSDYIRSHYLPCQAFLVALLPPALFWVTLLLIILLCGIWRRSEVGVLIDAFIILSSIILSMDMWPSISLPMSYTTLRSIHPEYYGMQKYWHVILVFIILDLSMIIFMVMSVKKMDFAFENENKE